MAEQLEQDGASGTSILSSLPTLITEQLKSMYPTDKFSVYSTDTEERVSLFAAFPGSCFHCWFESTVYSLVFLAKCTPPPELTPPQKVVLRFWHTVSTLLLCNHTSLILYNHQLRSFLVWMFSRANTCEKQALVQQKYTNLHGDMCRTF